MAKKLIQILLFLLVLACDKVENPLPTVYGDFNWELYPNDPTTYPYDIANPSINWTLNTNEKGILLEDYTGHKCTNCPAAATIATQLEDDTALGVIVVSVHASTDGSFQSTDEVEFTVSVPDDLSAIPEMAKLGVKRILIPSSAMGGTSKWASNPDEVFALKDLIQKYAEI